MLKILPHLVLLAITTTMLLMAGCAKPPQAELGSARRAVAQAYAAGAVELAGDDYQAAQAALRNAERLASQGEYGAAREILSTAEAQAKLAAGKARETRAQNERARLKQQRLDQKRRQQKRAAEGKKQQQAASKKKSQPAPPPPQPVNNYKVKGGETLWQIAARPEVYADEMLWPLLYKANRDQITDPRKIYAGQQLTVPRRLSEQQTEEARQEAKESGIYPPPSTPSPQS